MKLKNVIITLLVLSALSTYAQFKKIETPNVYYQADIYKDNAGEIYSTLLNIKFNQRLIDLPMGIKETKYDVMKTSTLKTLLKNIKQKYGDFKLKKVYINAVWGDNKRKNKRNGKWVTISERSQVFELIFDKPQSINKIINELKQNEYVEYVEGPAEFIPCIQPNDYYFSNGNQWELDSIDAVKSWDITKGSSDIHISINDAYGWTNVTKFHEDVINKFDYHYSTTKFGYHGTKVATVAAGETNNSIGVASLGWNTRLMGDEWGGSYIDSAVIRGADVINFSWITTSPGYRDAILNAIRQGVVCVAAIGNDSSNMHVSPPVVRYPAGYFWYPDTQVIAVSATIWDINQNEVIPSNWNYSPGTNPVTDPVNSFVDFAAPGGPIKVTHDSLLNAYVNNWGTSLSAPQVSALCALLISINNTLEPHHIYEILKNSAEKVGSVAYDANGWNQYLGYGRINAYKALKYALENYGGTLSNNLTIASGETWNFSEGVTITFQNGSALIVNGTLNVNGTSNNKVTLNFQYPQWVPVNGIKNEIKVNSSGHANISHANIHNAYTGIYINQGSATIDNCLITNGYSGIHLYNTNSTNNETSITNTRIYEQTVGIDFYNSTFVHLSHNQIDHNYIALNTYSSSPYLAPDDYNSESVGYNNIHTNSFGLMANYNSNPWLGRVSCTSFGGNNTIDGNTMKDVNLTNNCQVYAENNWWNFTPISYVGTGCFFDPYPFLYSAPSQSSAVKITPEEEEFNNKFNIQVTSSAKTTEKLSLVTSTNDKTGYDESWPIEWKLLYARNLMRVKKYNQAAKICESVITEYPDSARTYLALDLLWQSRKKEKSTHFSEFVKDKAKLKTNKQLFGVAELMLSATERTNRLSALDGIENKYKDTPLVEHILFQKFMYYLYEENNIELAKTTADELGKLYPESESYYSSQRHLGNDVVKPTEQLLTKEAVNEATTEIPQTYELLGNYPNPFNPSTTIKYALPYSSDVELTIYDITGKVITTLNRNGQSAGYQNIVWNGNSQQGSRVSSGVYFYRFKAASLDGSNKVFEKTAKLLMLK